MCRILAATAARDRAACRPLSVSGTAFVAQVAVGRSENGGGSKRRFGLVLEKRRENIWISNKALKVRLPAGRVAAPHRRRWDQPNVQATGRPETRSGIECSRNSIKTTTHYGLPVGQTQASAGKQV